MANSDQFQHSTEVTSHGNAAPGILAASNLIQSVIEPFSHIISFDGLQNNLMELWSLLHFLMPHVFSSRKEFSYWFSNPMNNIIEGNTSRNDELIGRLHGIIRPFVLRRLKKEVEKQMPGKFEHIVKTQLSRRQVR